MAVRMVLLAVLSACGFQTPASNAGACYGSLVRVCFPTEPTAPRAFNQELTLDTDSTDPAVCDQDNDKAASYCVIAGTTFELSGRIIARGTKPLVLVSTSAVALSGIIDVSSHVVSGAGAGALSAEVEACKAAAQPTIASGGYGGTFHGHGGEGGDANPDDGAKGRPGQAVSGVPTVLRGGCAGATGAGNLGTSGQGGPGGGAVAIVAMAITVSGIINASGAAGLAGSLTRSGGGGGGSGGMVVLDAPSITPNGEPQLFANGGGGGQGGGQGLMPGDLPFDGGESTSPQQQGPPGINPATPGGPGGAGSVGIMLNGTNAASADPSGGGGGGGGGAGLIHAPGVTGPTVISPPSIDR